MRGGILPVPPGLGTTAQGHSTVPEGAIHIDGDVNGASGSCGYHNVSATYLLSGTENLRKEKG